MNDIIIREIRININNLWTEINDLKGEIHKINDYIKKEKEIPNIDVCKAQIDFLFDDGRAKNNRFRDIFFRLSEIEKYIEERKNAPTVDCGELNNLIQETKENQHEFKRIYDRIDKLAEAVAEVNMNVKDYLKKPHRCPFCSGCGNIKTEVEPKVLKIELCISCQGKGILWG